MIDTLLALLESPLPTYDLGQLHPALAGADGVYLAAMSFVCWVGGHVITRGELLGK
jgi:hypothetical protein